MLLNSAIGLSGPAASSQSTARLHSRKGFRLELFAADVPKARMLRPTSAGDLLVSQSHLGQILLLRADRDGNGSADGSEVLLADLDRPHGIDIHDDWLYIGESGAIGRIRFDAARGRVSGGYERILEGLPAGGNHWTRTLRVGRGPDGATSNGSHRRQRGRCSPPPRRARARSTSPPRYPIKPPAAAVKGVST